MHQPNSRGTSIKTRIETDVFVPRTLSPIIQEAHPLKQGLKPNAVGIAIRIILIQEAHPLKQGLKPEIIHDKTISFKFKRHIH